MSNLVSWKRVKKIDNDKSSKKITTNYVCNYVDCKNILFLCSMEICDVYKSTKYGNMEGNSPLIDLRLVKIVKTKINENQKKSKFSIINGNLNLLG